ncbi:MAG: triosephosphate isomerase [Candidatus Nealsonbacteria bacterium]|nr:triosephosphate isomerase [Candidatus Nealsonbacteria bacterium]
MAPLIVANWKMNPATLKEAVTLFSAVKEAGAVICPPFVYLSALKANGAQDCFWENPPAGGGAYTGEVSPQMLKNLGVEYVLIGHSERRKYQGETNEVAEKKLKAALAAGLKPILCIDKISQLPKDIKEGFIVAYEPLFAIGTGKPCSFEMADEMIVAIKNKVKVTVLYGGSVNSQNAADYIKKAHCDGLLVGGASLKPAEFIDIVKNAC